MGVGVARGKGGTDGKTALRLFAVWLLTFPSCFALSYLAMRLVMR
jgi:phosphate/sulfate permease